MAHTPAKVPAWENSGLPKGIYYLLQPTPGDGALSPASAGGREPNLKKGQFENPCEHGPTSLPAFYNVSPWGPSLAPHSAQTDQSPPYKSKLGSVHTGLFPLSCLLLIKICPHLLNQCLASSLTSCHPQGLIFLGAAPPLQWPLFPTSTEKMGLTSLTHTPRSSPPSPSPRAPLHPVTKLDSPAVKSITTLHTASPNSPLN